MYSPFKYLPQFYMERAITTPSYTGGNRDLDMDPKISKQINGKPCGILDLAIHSAVNNCRTITVSQALC